MTFRIGQKIVCVDAGDMGFLVKGSIYTVSGRCRVCANYPDDYDKYTYIDIVGHPHSCGTRCNSWRVKYFRPLVEDRKSVSFTTGAPKDSEKWDNRKVVSPRHRVRVNG